MNPIPPIPPHHSNPLDVATHAQRLAREHQGDRIGLVFNGITAISLGVMTTKMILDMFRDRHDSHRRNGRER